MKSFTRIFTIMLILLVGLVIGMNAPVLDADATLSKGKAETLMGYSLSTPTGNATGAGTGVRIGKGSEWPTQYYCYGFVVNSAGTSVVNTATVAIQTSYDNVRWFNEGSLAIGASAVNSISNSGASAGRYWRANVTAIQNASNTYATVQCLFD